MIKTVGKVYKHIRCVQSAIMLTVVEMQKRAFSHDASKFEPQEFKGHARFEDFPEGLEYGKDEYKAAMSKVMEGNDCFELHSIRNDHHPEYYDNEPKDMPMFALIEMVCDWAGATLAYGNKGNWGDCVEHNLGRWDFSEGQKYVIRETAEFLKEKMKGLQ